MSAHTPGPWEWGRDLGSFWVEVGKTGYSVAAVSNHNMKPENEANACLIAAAPELLRAAEHALSDFYFIERTVPNSNFQASILLLEHTIAKATGAA